MNSLYILDINLLSNISFENIFFHSLGCFFIQLISSFTVRNSLVSCSPICLFFCFYFPSLGRQIIKNTAKTDIKDYASYLFFQDFKVLGLKFNSLIPFEIFLNMLRRMVQFQECGCPVSPPPFIEEAFFTPCVFMLPLSQIINQINLDLFLGYLFCSMDLCVYFLCQYSTVLINTALQYSLISKNEVFPALFFSSELPSLFGVF